MLRTLFAAAVLAAFCMPVWGQAMPAAEASRWQVGGAFSFGPPDYTLPYIKGITAYASYDVGAHSGMIVEAHFENLSTPQFVGENSFLVGGRYGITKFRFHPYLKALVGIGMFQFKPGFIPPKTGTNSYEIYAAGGGIDYYLLNRLNVRIADFEYQGWPAFQPDGLTPWIISTGVAYKF